MTAKGKTFVWAPDEESICVRVMSIPLSVSFIVIFQLYSSGLGVPQTYARVTREEGAVALEISEEAIQIGLLEICVTAAFLLQSGRKID